MTAVVDALWRAAYRVVYLVLRGWWRIRHPTQRGAFVAVWRGEDLLVIRNSYRGGVTVPCGNVGRRESPREAARRELEEEVGISVALDELEFICDLNVAFEGKDDHAYFFELFWTADTRVEISIDHREVIWAEFRPRGSLGNVGLVPHVEAYLAHRNS